MDLSKCLKKMDHLVYGEKQQPSSLSLRPRKRKSKATTKSKTRSFSSSRLSTSSRSSSTVRRRSRQRPTSSSFRVPVTDYKEKGYTTPFKHDLQSSMPDFRMSLSAFEDNGPSPKSHSKKPSFWTKFAHAVES